MLQKNLIIRSKKMLDAARGESCVRCDANDGTVVAAHYSGIYATRFGRGRGIKPHDFCVADLCSRCHGYFDSYENGNTDERAAEFMTYVLLTIHRRVINGDIIIKGAKNALD